MKAAEYSAAVVESTMVEIITNRYSTGVLGRAPCSAVPIHMKAPERDLALVSDRYEASEWTFRIKPETWMRITFECQRDAYGKKRSMSGMMLISAPA